MIGKTVQVLDKGFIQLVDVMGDDHAIVAAARASYKKTASKGDSEDKKLLFYLLRNRHTTPFEMVEFKFLVKAPLLVTQQWMRHRMWSYNSSSARYTPATDNDFYIPRVWRLQAMDNKQGSEGASEEITSSLLTALLTDTVLNSYRAYQLALHNGIAKEQARLFLPGFAYYYTFIAKTDAHNLMHFLKLRMDPHAQYEIRQYATAIYEHFFRLHLPWTAEAFEEYILHE